MIVMKSECAIENAREQLKFVLNGNVIGAGVVC
jgi:hypothetical protein